MRVLLAVAFAWFCAAPAAGAQAKPGNVLVKGVDTAPLKVMIRTIDGGDVLWAGPYRLGTEAWVTPGAHRINVMCEFHHSWGQVLLPGNVEIHAKSGVVYELTGDSAPGGKTCAVRVSQRTGPAKADETKPVTKPVKHIRIDVIPYYEAAQTPAGTPKVAVGFDAQLASNKREDIVAARDAIQAQPQRTTPMTLMVLAIRLYDVGLRDDAVFWFYVAKNRYFTLLNVVNVGAPELARVAAAMPEFKDRAGSVINGYAFCDLTKQREAAQKAITWVEKNPYEAIFRQQLPALPGNRAENLKKSIASLKEMAEKERQYLADPKNLEEFNRNRKANHMLEQFCWSP